MSCLLLLHVTSQFQLFLTVFLFSLSVSMFQKKNMRLLLSVFLLGSWGVFLLGFRLYWMGNKPPNFSNSDNPAADCPSLLTRALTFFYLPAVNVWLLLCPDMLSFDWSMDALPLLRSVTDLRNLHTVAFYAGLLALTWFGLCSSRASKGSKGKETNGKAHHVANGKSTTNGHSYHSDYEHSIPDSESVQANGNGTKNHYVARTSLPTTENVVVFSLGLLAIPFLPATNLFFYVGFVVAERVLYIPSMGFCLLVAVGVRALWVRLRRRSCRTLVLACSAALVLVFGVKTVLRNQDWHNEEMLYKSGITVNPAKAWGNLGNVLKNQGKMDEAERAYRNALYYRRNMADMLYNLGLLLQENSKFSEALQYYKLAIGSRPTLACKCTKKNPHLYKREAYMRLNKLSEAAHWYRESLRAKPDHIPAHLTYGKLLAMTGQKAEAEKYFLKAIQLDPAKGNCYMHYGKRHLLLYLSLFQLKELQASLNDAAEKYYKQAASLRPNYPAALMNLGAILHLNGKLQEAEANYLRALQLKPDDTITQSNLRKLWNIMEKQGLRTMAP
uniref:dolichyl-phosphate-mannose--protein mannosyltransferase n=1 Tax=Astyanax mexicanus TaxID=7994 RepID=A0A8B9LEU0_ASTMX